MIREEASDTYEKNEKIQNARNMPLLCPVVLLNGDDKNEQKKTKKGKIK